MPIAIATITLHRERARERKRENTYLLLDIVNCIAWVFVAFIMRFSHSWAFSILRWAALRLQQEGNSQSGAAAAAGAAQMSKSNNSKTQQTCCRKQDAGASEHTRVAHVARTVRARANYNFYCCQKQINANKLFVALCRRTSPTFTAILLLCLWLLLCTFCGTVDDMYMHEHVCLMLLLCCLPETKHLSWGRCWFWFVVVVLLRLLRECMWVYTHTYVCMRVCLNVRVCVQVCMVKSLLLYEHVCMYVCASRNAIKPKQTAAET